MCGLAGIFDPNGAEVDQALLKRMTAAIAHRGPDGAGFHCEPGIGLGHRRLAIIDIGGGHQPMANEDGSVMIVFNGQIYNYQDLWPELQALGHIFRSDHSDTEVILHAWESWGPACLERLSGMFAFAIWDRNRRSLFLARDRMGKKPMHYGRGADGRVYFASELAALAEVPGLEGGIDPASVEDFFTYGYIPDPGTIFRGIRKLPAAHGLLFEPGMTALPAPRRYWRAPATGIVTDEASACGELISRLRAATARRLMSDVPLGAFLSGGVDSSAVVAMAAEARRAAGQGALDTFTIGFEGAEDETPYATMVSRRYGTTQYNDRAASIDMIEAARLQARWYGEPFGDSSAPPTSVVSSLARRHAMVALSGDGGDEVFLGYRRYRWQQFAEAVRRYLPAGVRRPVLGTLARIYPKLDRAPRFLRAKYLLTELSLDSALGYYRMVAKLQDDRRRSLFSPALRVSLDGYDPSARIGALMEESGSDDAMRQAQYVDLATWLSGGILTKVDRASMAHSLEVRAPFLDEAVVEFGFSLPAALKLGDGSGKHVLKRALEPYLPRELLYRPKQGFATSLASTFRAEAERVRARVLGGPMLECGLFSCEGVTRLLDEHFSGRFDHSQPIWQLLTFEGFLALRPHVRGL